MVETVRVLLADDHAHVRAQLRARLARESFLEIVGEAGNASQVVAAISQSEPDILLIDPMMRDGLGVAALKQIAERFPQVAIVVLTAAADTALNMELRQAGVRQILNKSIDSNLLIETLDKIKNEIHNHSSP